MKAGAENPEEGKGASVFEERGACEGEERGHLPLSPPFEKRPTALDSAARRSFFVPPPLSIDPLSWLTSPFSLPSLRASDMKTNAPRPLAGDRSARGPF